MIGSAAGDSERPRRRKGGTPLWLHVAVALAALALTLGAWAVTRDALAERDRERFERAAGLVVDQLEETLERQAGLLRAVAGFVEAEGDDDERVWRAFIDTLDLERRYPALTNVAAIRLVRRPERERFLAAMRARHPDFMLRPEHDEPLHLPIVQIARKGTEALLGYDIAFEGNRRRAVAHAFADDAVRLTGPVHPGGREASGVIMVAPYRGAGELRGVVATAMLFEELFTGTLSPARRAVRLRVLDGDETLVDETADPSDPEVDPEPLLVGERALSAHGRTWRIEIETTRGFRATAGFVTPWIVLGTGLVLGTLLVALLWLYARTEKRLRAERAALAESNELLETFACVVSHDLKAPLLGIRMLADVIEEDVLEGGPDVGARVLASVERVRARLGRARTLIEDVLDYSAIGRAEERIEPVEPAALVREIGDSLGLAPGSLAIEGAAPSIETSAQRLRQTLTNLIGNAYKYHDRPEAARVGVRVDDLGEALRFTVTDDGPGIDPALHARIFEPFVRGGGSDRAEGTGVGLAIVKRGIDSVGGTLELRSTPGTGSSFAFTWPKRAAAFTDGGAGTSARVARLRPWRTRRGRAPRPEPPKRPLAA